LKSYGDLETSLLRRFKDVPAIEAEDVREWLDAAYGVHDLSKNTPLSEANASLALLYAEATGASAIAIRTAHYFSVVDKDESIDKSGIAGEYRRLSEVLWRNYRRAKEELRPFSGGSAMHFMRRVDR